MASINRKIQGKEKDITYSIDGTLAGVVVNNQLYVPFGENPEKSQLKQFNAMLKKAKQRDGVKGAIAGVGSLSFDNNEVMVSFHGSNFPVNDFMSDVEAATV